MAKEYKVYEAVYDDEYRKLAKRLNQRLVEAERRDIKSPGIKAMKGILDTLGRRRFSETGKAASKEELSFMKKQLKRLEKQATTTVTGYKQYREQVLSTAREKYNLSELGISDDEYLDIWDNLNDDKTKRVYDSDVYIAILRAAKRKGGKDLKVDSEMIVKTLEEEADKLRNKKGKLTKKAAAKAYRNALKEIGVTSREVNSELRTFEDAEE